jgi:CheY-like chemotaxis protein
MTSMLIADDHAVMRSGLRMLLENEDDFEVAAEAGDVAETIRKLKASSRTSCCSTSWVRRMLAAAGRADSSSEGATAAPSS